MTDIHYNAANSIVIGTLGLGLSLVAITLFPIQHAASPEASMVSAFKSHPTCIAALISFPIKDSEISLYNLDLVSSSTVRKNGTLLKFGDISAAEQKSVREGLHKHISDLTSGVIPLEDTASERVQPGRYMIYDVRKSRFSLFLGTDQLVCEGVNLTDNSVIELNGQQETFNTLTPDQQEWVTKGYRSAGVFKAKMNWWKNNSAT